MPNTVLLLGAGFSKNWGGLVASQVGYDLMARLQGNAQLTAMLNRTNFEDTLTLFQGAYLNQRAPEYEERLILFQGALFRMFDRMNRYFQSRPFEFQTRFPAVLRNF
jgi:hypothetical protein